MHEVPRTADEIPQRQHNSDRMRRARSWLERGEAATTDGERFIFLWIAFNAAYGSDALDSESLTQRQQFSDFLGRVLERDAGNDIERIIWDTFSGPIRILLENQYVFTPFWKWVQGAPEGANWQVRFERETASVRRKLSRQDVHGVLRIVFDRLYTLRNQVFHGGATFPEGWGQSQVHDGSRIMASLVPVVLAIMQADIDRDPDTAVWGTVAYPRINLVRE